MQVLQALVQGVQLQGEAVWQQAASDKDVKVLAEDDNVTHNFQEANDFLQYKGRVLGIKTMLLLISLASPSSPMQLWVPGMQDNYQR